MDGESIRVTRSVVLPLAEIDFRFSRSSGPGGQHAKSRRRASRRVFDVEASQALTDVQKRRVVARAGPTIRAVAQDERSQSRNRELAVERLVDQLREALRVERGAEADEAGTPPPRAAPRGQAPPLADEAPPEGALGEERRRAACSRRRAGRAVDRRLRGEELLQPRLGRVVLPDDERGHEAIVEEVEDDRVAGLERAADHDLVDSRPRRRAAGT